MPLTAIFIGPQGSGKGTQGILLKEELARRYGEENAFHFSTGDGFRALVNAESYTSELACDSLNRGDIQPVFLAVWLWASVFADKIKKDTHIITDGFPRGVVEAKVLDEAFDFYKRDKRVVFSLMLSDTSSMERMLLRARADDTEEGIKERLKQYHERTEPVLDYYKGNEKYSVIEIDAEPAVDEIKTSIQSHVDTLLS